MTYCNTTSPVDAAPGLNPDTEIVLLKQTLRKCISGEKDALKHAAFVLDNPNAAQSALGTYLQQQARVVEETDKFLAGDREDTTVLEREMQKLLRMRGYGSKPPIHRVGARSTKRQY